ncbi:caspase family protein [Enterobacter hormaechei]|uniref:caspase family protein n=1 Tax=Enterobacter hormaechei TaxID=158836 RepID=UPI0028742474|nr:caspase family protein [Enterobacter hormaechei]MDS0009969.1 caspase family protein [Enterobacter hormaechei subsp. xiangfangensis]
MNLGIVIGVEKYKIDLYDDLKACRNDAKIFKDVLENVKAFDEILYLNNDESGTLIKRSIADFIEKYKDKDVAEFLFYFSGHGERFEDDFFYLPSDFDSKKRETTGLRNSELDEWMKSISPKLCVKIVDACFSGTQYIKSESSAEQNLRKSAKKYGLNDLYFWFSSRDDEVSYAGTEISRFTESILTSLLERDGDVRYREIMDAVADDFSNSGSSSPIFVTQSSNLEKFGLITNDTHQLIYKAFGITSDDDIKGNETGKDLLPLEANTQPILNVYDLVSIKSKEVCFDEDTLSSFIRDFNSRLSSWNDDIKNLYTITVDASVSVYNIPNKIKLGQWLEKNKEKNYFAIATFAIEEYQAEEYKALPKKPKSGYSSIIERMGIFGGLEDEIEYKLEKVTKEKSYVDGFQYSHSLGNRILQISFEPLFEIIEPICIYVVPFYSNRDVTINFSYEFLKRRSWGEYFSPECNRWRNIKVNINTKDAANTAAEHIQKEVEGWLKDNISKTIE